MNNKYFNSVKNYIKHTKNIELLLVLPYMHRVKTVEKAINIFKSHFTTDLTTVNSDFPLHLWCHLLPLATTTLNLLWLSRINPKVSAYEILHGTFDYNKKPLALLGTKVIVYDSITKQKIWDPHGSDG